MSNTEQLVEIKKGQIGHGLLIEHDGHICDNNEIVKQIHEDINNNHKFVIPEHFVVSAVFQKYDVKNANGRIYPERILKREVEKYFEKINNRNALGSLDHPSSSALSGHDISHNILNLEWKGKTLIGEMELHLSPGYIRYGVCSTSGDLVANMLLSNYLIGVSSRGVGSVENKFNTYIVGDDFDLICWDVVIENSTPGAVIRNTKEELIPFMESKENNMNENKIEKIFKILNE